MNRQAIFLCPLISLLACVPQELLLRPTIPIEAGPQKTPVQSSSAKKLEKLTAIIANDTDERQEVEDVVAILHAQVNEEQGRKDESMREWFKALRLAKGNLGRDAFEAWVQSYAEELDVEFSFQTLAELVLKETHNGTLSPHMMDMELTNTEALLKAFPSIFNPPRFRSHAKSRMGNLDSSYTAPSKAGPPQDDVLLFNIAKNYCNSDSSQTQHWDAWVHSLGPQIHVYWDALVLECKNENTQAIETYYEALPELSMEADLIPYAIASCQRLIKLQTRSALRADVAGTYDRLMDLWEHHAIKASAMGMMESEFQFQRIDDYLSAARALALVGQYPKARAHIQTATRYIRKAQSTLSHLSREDRDKLMDFKADSYHIQASRIALENKEYSHASSLVRVALQIPNLSQEWIERLLWTRGLYEFLDEKTGTAREIWQSLLEKSSSGEMRARVFFWIAKTYNIEEREDKRDQYLTLLRKEYPLSFYSIIASTLSSNIRSNPLSEILGSPEALIHKLSENRNYKLENLRQHKVLSHLLLRTEILVSAELYNWARYTARELLTTMKTQFPLAQHREEYLYVSRLLHAAQDYKASIALSSAIADNDPAFWSKWPEQILIFFPQPFADIQQRKSEEEGIDLTLLYAIQRQESLFDREAHSSAGALGLMQLIPATAKAMATDSASDSPELLYKLFQPELNIKLGSRYIKKLHLYFKGDQTAVIAGYNAGEFAVDYWLEHRPREIDGIWLETIPFQQTRQYVEAVLRNYYVYKYLKPGLGTVVIKRSMDYKNRAQVFLPKERGP